jgi:hypothetical protein
MASKVDIANICLEILGKPSIASLTDNSNAARAVNSTYDLERRARLMGRATWRFSMTRASLPALSAVPVSGPYTQQFALPTDCMRVILAGDIWPGLDLSDYKLGPTDAAYSVEGRNILCDYGAPLSLLYVADIEDTTQFDAWFVEYLGACLAYKNCERLTGSDAKQQLARSRMDAARTEATASNALVNPPQTNADDTWMAARMQ